MVVLDAAGDAVGAAGDVESPMFPRSSNKPMQAIGMLRAGLRLTDPADLALVSASHWGEHFHVARVARDAAHRRAGRDGAALPARLPLGPGGRRRRDRGPAAGRRGSR